MDFSEVIKNRICKMLKMLFISNENRGQEIHIRCCICKKLEESSYEYKKRTD